ncbi:MAG: diguanylate cyclase [Chloroflexi bacterium]|nr:diguanylate cyclase [Chloroflexota bacterium]
MPIPREALALLPAAAAAAVAFVAEASGAPLLAAVLGASAVGSLVGVACVDALLRSHARALERAMASLADDNATDLPDPARLGGLGPAARQLARVADTLRSAQTDATTDRLTRVANRPTLLAHLFAEVERVTRYSRPLSVAFIDLDHFKAVNDTYGHEVGDIVLRGVADVFREQTRSTDFVGRYGGEEFVVVLPEITVEDATAVAEKLRLLVMKQRFAAGDGTELGVSVSIGIAGGRGQHLRVDQLLRDADAAMYAAKSLGRNQTYVFAEEDDDSARIPRAPISLEARQRAADVGDQARRAAEGALAAVLAPLPHYRGQPSSLIAAIAVRMATELGLPEPEVERIRVAALLHDVGKLAVPEQVLEKPGPLSADEWQKVVQHPRIGQAIIERVMTLGDAGAIILHHHEQFSGHGYPYGLRGSDIPLGARIVAIADAYDAMVRDRPYRRAIGHEGAVQELRRYAQVQFDPELVDLFCDLYAEHAPAGDPSLLTHPPARVAQLPRAAAAR